MEYMIKSKYLVFPVNTLCSKKHLTFQKNEQTVYSLDISLDLLTPTFYAYIDVSRFAGESLRICVEPEMEIRFTEADTLDIEGLYREPMRPQIHFTTKNGWMNDPNGLIYLDGIYHMFYQHNPADATWGNMHWGHAVSRDLIRWEEKDIALFPDERGAMFSGSALLDEGNLLGLGDSENKAALLYYTTTEPFCQHLSYSTNRFQTIHRYGNQPVVPHIAGDNRDPKVIFCDELGCYILALYLEEDKYCLMRSSDLIHWETFQQFHLPGDNECPDIFPLQTKTGERKWIIIGAHDKYLVGHFASGKFEADQQVMSLHYGTSAYAGQSFSNLPGDRRIRMEWDTWHLPTDTICGQMGIPMELTLAKYADTYYLQANPIREVAMLYQNTNSCSALMIAPDAIFQLPLDSSAQLLKLHSAHPNTGKLTIAIFGISMKLDFDKNELQVGDCIAPICVTGGDLDVTVIVDRCSIEVYADGGKIFLSCLDRHTVSDYNLPYLSIRGTQPLTLDSLEIHSLKSIWSN